jgi:hypothetical protein
MSLWIDVKYVNILGAQLPLFKRCGDYTWNFRCVICGDSKTKKNKARGYIYKVESQINVRCHNCNYSANLGNFIKQINENLHTEYIFEKYKDKPPLHPVVSPDSAVVKAPVVINNILNNATRLDKLPKDHPAIRYVLKRAIPENLLYLFYYTSHVKKFINKARPGTFKSVYGDYPRLIIPYYNRNHECFMFQARAFSREEPKYISIKISEEEKIYGLDRIDFSKRIYMVEGPIDSIFLPNALAASGSSFDSKTVQQIKPNLTLVYDQESRSIELTTIVEKSIDSGFDVCIWPNNIIEKDINKMILAGRTAEQIVKIINENTYHGIEAKLRFTQWKKC